MDERAAASVQIAWGSNHMCEVEQTLLQVVLKAYMVVITCQ